VCAKATTRSKKRSVEAFRAVYFLPKHPGLRLFEVRAARARHLTPSSIFFFFLNHARRAWHGRYQVAECDRTRDRLEREAMKAEESGAALSVAKAEIARLEER